MEKRRNVVNHRTTEYQYGSAVRKLQSVPEIHTYEHEIFERKMFSVVIMFLVKNVKMYKYSKSAGNGANYN